MRKGKPLVMPSDRWGKRGRKDGSSTVKENLRTLKEKRRRGKVATPVFPPLTRGAPLTLPKTPKKEGGGDRPLR